MEGRNEAPLNFHSQFEQHDSVRIRDSFIHNGHITEEVLPETNQVWTSLYVEDPAIIGAYDKRIRKNLHHKYLYAPVKITYG
jgi:hypothetical protein